MKTNVDYLPLAGALLLLLTHSCSDLGVEDVTYVPAQLNDGWQVSSATAQDLDPQMMTDGYREMATLPYAYSLLVVRNGFLVGEQYFHGNRRENANRIMSVSKSILSALAGIALETGGLDSLNHPVLDFFPEYATPSLDARKRTITVKHLLTMRAGFDTDEKTYFLVYNSSDWIRTTIELPLAANPGQRMIYCTFGTHLLSGTLTRASGQSMLEFARNRLSAPLGITIASWESDPQGFYFGGNGMNVKPRDMARFGLLFLRNGNLDGKQIVPQQWIQESLRNSSGWQGKSWGDIENINYGYLWWLGEINGIQTYFALGHGGQLILNIPALDMIAVSTANPDFDWDTADEHERAVIHVIARYIVAAARRPND